MADSRQKILMEKAERQSAIRQIIGRSAIMSQAELKAGLLDAGFRVAQATLSRDINEMGIVKTASGYQIGLITPEAGAGREVEITDGKPFSVSFMATGTSKPIPTGSVTGLEFGVGVAVMHTPAGHANMVASIIDTAALPQIMGTIAGDDTVLLILRRGYTEQETFAALDTLADGLETPE